MDRQTGKETDSGERRGQNGKREKRGRREGDREIERGGQRG